jgi:hypothetical protein
MYKTTNVPFFPPTTVHQNNAGSGIEFDLRERMFWTRTIIKHHIQKEIAGNSGQQLTLTGFVKCAANRRKNRSLKLRKGRWLKVFENRVPRRIFGPKRDEVTGYWKKTT